MDPEQEGAPEAPRRSAHEPQDAHREHALRDLQQREAELDRASSELERIRERYMSELSEGRTDPTLERLLHEAKERYQEATERYEELKEGDDHSGDSLENQLSKAWRVYTEAADELQGAYRQLKSIRTLYEQAYDNSEDTTPLQFHLQQAEKRYQEAKERYDRAEKRYREVKEDAQRSTSAGEIHAYHPPSCVGPATPTSFCSDVSILVSLLGRRSPETRRHQALRFRLPLS